jgi:hypothetical protein
MENVDHEYDHFKKNETNFFYLNQSINTILLYEYISSFF